MIMWDAPPGTVQLGPGTLIGTAAAPQSPAQLATAHFGIVAREVNALAGHWPAHVDRDDLLGAGTVGLVEAAGRYDPSRGVPFGAYARLRVRGAILDAARSDDWATRGVRRAERLLGADAGPSGVEPFAGTAHRADARRAMALFRGTSLYGTDAIDAAVERGTAAPVGAMYDCTVDDAMDRLSDAEQHDSTRQALAELPERLRWVMLQLFWAGRTQTEIADELGLGKGRVSQLKTEALARLRDLLADKLVETDRVPSYRHEHAMVP